MNATVNNVYLKPSRVELSWLITRIRRDRMAVVAKVCAAIVASLTLLLITGTVIKLNAYAEEITRLRSELSQTTSQVTNLTQANTELLEANAELQEAVDIYAEAAESIPTYKEIIDEQTATIDSLIADNESLAEEYDQVSAAYDTLKDREELYDKYGYAIMYDGKRTDLTYDIISYGEELMLDKGLDPDLLFSIGMVESRFASNTKNKYSTASGYYQFLNGTGKFVYISLMGNNSYSHSYAFDGYTSTEMAVEYLSYLNDSFDGNTFSVVKQYSGRNTKDTYIYINEMNKFLRYKNESFQDIVETNILLASSR